MTIQLNFDLLKLSCQQRDHSEGCDHILFYDINFHIYFSIFHQQFTQRINYRFCGKSLIQKINSNCTNTLPGRASLITHLNKDAAVEYKEQEKSAICNIFSAIHTVCFVLVVVFFLCFSVSCEQFILMVSGIKNHE